MSNDSRITHTVVPATIVAGFAAINPACRLSAEPASPQHDMMRATALALVGRRALNQATVRILGLGPPAGCIGAIRRISSFGDRTVRIRTI
jgi:hypothetical protein